MRTSLHRWFLAAVLGLPGNALPAQPQAAGPIVELPPMIVSEVVRGPVWLYARAGSIEYLSRAPASTTRDFIRSQQQRLQLLEAIVPPDFLVKSDVLWVTLLFPEELNRADDAVAQDTMKGGRGPAPAPVPLPGRPAPGLNAAPVARRFLPHLRIDDRDVTALFAYLNPRTFDGSRLVMLPDYVRLLLERRTPMLPAWLVEGVVSVYRRASWVENPVALGTTVWLSSEESRWLLRDAERPRVLLPMNELFAPDALAQGEGQGKRAQIWREQVALFFRWSLDPRHDGAREAFWRFAARAAAEPPTEEMFEACFGFGYSDMRDRLGDYLPLAVKAPLHLDPGRLPRLPAVDVERASAEQVARLRGEWERAEISYVKTHHPQVQEQYVAEARRTLHRAYEQGIRDPRLIATLALCEIDAGDEAAALPFLEQAASARVARPRVYHELARVRFRALTRDQPPGKMFSAAEIESVVAPLRIGLTQAPALPESFLLFADAWLRSSARPSETDFALVAQGVRLFQSRPSIGYGATVLQLKHGRFDEARATLARGLARAPDAATRSRFEAIARALPASAPP